MNQSHSRTVGSVEEACEKRQELLQRFFDYLRYERNASSRTLGSYGESLAQFDQHLAANAPDVTWDTVDADLIRQWVIEMMDRGSKATTVNCRLSALRSFYKFMLRREYVQVDPAHNVTGPKEEKTLPSYVRDSEMNTLLDGDFFPGTYTGVRDRTILLTLYSAGLRASELIALQLSNIDLATMQLKVTGKRNKQRIVPFGEEMRTAMEYYLARRAQLLEEHSVSTQSLFLMERNAKPMGYGQLRMMVNKYLAMVTTARKKSPHTLRHTFATSMLNHQADLRSVKELLGHESLATTEIYTHASFADLQNAYQMAHPRAHAKDDDGNE